MVKISDRIIGAGQPVFVIAEISANHGQDFDRAVELVREAKECGADAVKFQAYTPETMTIDSNKEYFMLEHPQWGGQSLFDLYKIAYTPWDWFKKLKKIAEDIGIVFLCTAFDRTSVDMLEELDVCAHKTASFELVDIPLIKYIAKTGKPLILSTGMAEEQEIREAFEAAKNGATKEVALLKCVSNYPTKPEEMNLKTIPDMQEHFNCPVGLSDHSLEIGASIAAVVLGACIIEKHFTLSRKDSTPDSFFSMEPEEFKELVDNIRITERALGEIRYGPTSEEKVIKNLRRSLFVVTDVRAGEKVSHENTRSIRPGHGLHPRHTKEIMGQVFKKNVSKGTPFSRDLI